MRPSSRLNEQFLELVFRKSINLDWIRGTVITTIVLNAESISARVPHAISSHPCVTHAVQMEFYMQKNMNLNANLEFAARACWLVTL